MTKTHDNRSAECSDPSCPCHEWSAKSSSESPALPEREVDCPVSETKNVLNGDSEPNSPIPAACIARVSEARRASDGRIEMREEIKEFAYGKDLFVYPFLTDDAPSSWMSGSARIEATHYPKPAVHCNVYFSRTEPLTREQWSQLVEAVARCWTWLDETAGGEGLR